MDTMNVAMFRPMGLLAGLGWIGSNFGIEWSVLPRNREFHPMSRAVSVRKTV
jgi:hypothetical protein